MFDKLAEELKQARIKNNISIQQLSTKIKIDTKFLEAMEAGDFAYLPEIYVKAFTKQYAKAVGLNDTVIIKKYEAIKKGIPYEPEIPVQKEKIQAKPEKEVVKEEKILPKKESLEPKALQSYVYNAVKSPSAAKEDRVMDKKKIILGSVLSGVIALFAVVYFLFLRQSPEIIVPEKPIEEVIKENKQRYIEKTKHDSTINKPIVSDSLNLTIQSKDTSWIKIILDDKKVDEFIIFPGSQKVLSAENNYKITFGNSGGIELSLNNKPLNFTGKKNAVKYALIDRNGITYLDNPPSL